jgi:hypothetical protein
MEQIAKNSLQLASTLVLLNAMEDARAHLREDIRKIMQSADIKSYETKLNSQRVGLIRKYQPKASKKVIDEAAFVAWVKKNWPEKIEETVNEDFRKEIMAEIELEETEGVDSVHLITGEYLPFIDISERKSYIAMTMSELERHLVKEAMESGELDGINRNLFPIWLEQSFYRLFKSKKLD